MIELILPVSFIQVLIQFCMGDKILEIFHYLRSQNKANSKSQQDCDNW